MNAGLFFDDDAEYFAIAELRAAARDVIASSSLIRRAGRGDMTAAAALHIGFWPFVREFEIAIDKQRLPRDPLRRKFNAAWGGRVNQVFAGLASALADMREEEGSHAKHWKKDAECLGLSNLDGPRVVGIQALVDASYSKDLPRFFAVLAGTEFVAEELSAYLTAQPAFLNLFSRNRWVWGEVHLFPHDDGPSHLEIDLDFARAYSPNDALAKSEIETMVVETIGLFSQAACEAEAAIAKAQRGEEAYSGCAITPVIRLTATP